MLQTKFLAKLKHILCSIMFFENRPIYEVCGKILYSRVGHRRQHDTCTLHAGYL